MADIRTKGQQLPSRMIVHGVEGVGKTSFAANAPAPIVLMSKGETGLETLIDNRQLAETPHFPECMSWSDALGSVESLLTEEHPHKTLVIDTINGLERLCHEHVCQRDYNGDWGKSGFTSYMQGYDVACADWRVLLALLDRLREEKRMGIIGLCHTKVTAFRNPEGADFDRFQPAVHAKTWELTHRWADTVLFANYYVATEKQDGRNKGKGGQNRVLYTVRHAAYDAKNRAGLPEEIEMGETGKEAWDNFISAVKAGRES